MRPKKPSFSGFVKTLPRNMFSGLVVSLIALPLGLGLAMASDAPPIAGVITAIIGGDYSFDFGREFCNDFWPRKWLGWCGANRYYNSWAYSDLCGHHLLWFSLNYTWVFKAW